MLDKILTKLNRILAKPSPTRRRLEIDGNTYSEIYAVGDVHGCLDQLIGAEQRIVSASTMAGARKLIVMLGDYVDRGPESAGVLDHLLGDPPEGFERICLCGNHEEMFLDFLISDRANRQWLDFGGDATLRSYGIHADHALRMDRSGKHMARLLQERVAHEHLDFLRQLPVSLSIGQNIFVHAGLRPGLPLEQQTDEDLLWIREPFLSEGAGFGRIVIHGHTPTARPVAVKGRIGIDTGAYMTGNLSVLQIRGQEYSFI